MVVSTILIQQMARVLHDEDVMHDHVLLSDEGYTHVAERVIASLEDSGFAIAPERATTLLQWGPVELHSGRRANFKINCDALTDEDIECLAEIIRSQVRFGKVVGIPRGGNRLAMALSPWESEGSTLLIDDVLTTGTSMWEAKAKLEEQGHTVIGRVIFARGPWPEWVQPVFWTSQWM